MSITVREAKPNDLADIVNLVNQLIPWSVRSEEIQKNLSSISTLPCMKLFVAELDSNIIGMCSVLIMPHLLGKSAGIIDEFVVDEKNRRRGVGKAMVEYLKKYCEEAGCYKIMLSSNVSRKAAHQFYRSLGMKQHGISFLLEL